MIGRRSTALALGAMLLVVACTSDDDDAASEVATTGAAPSTASTESAATTGGSTTATGGPQHTGGSTSGDVAAADVTREQVDAALTKIDGFVEAEMERSGVPGVAVAVVHDDEVVFAEGYGVREVGTEEPVSADTVFQIASLSKPVTGTAVAALVSKGVISWDEPVHPYSPELVFSDPWVTDHVTFADLYAHRSGLPGGIGDVLEAIGYSRDEVLARLRVVPLNPFRDSYAYTNFGMTAGGDAAAKAAGVSFEQMVEEQLLEPAGMSSSSIRYADFETRSDRATIHVRIDGEWVPGPARMPDAQAPAGGVSSTLNDMGRWVRLQLGGGTLDGKAIVSEEALVPTHTPHVVRPPAPTYDGPTHFYALGWNVDEDHLGHLRWAHSGAFTNGAATNATLLPTAGLGVVVLTNGMPIGVPETLVDQVIDQIVTGGQTSDWPAHWSDAFSGVYGEDPALSQLPDPPTPALANDSYLGSYANDFYGTFEVIADGDGMAVVEGPARVTFPLTHWDANTFTFVGGAMPDERATLEFTIGPDGRASALTIPDPDGLGTLQRI
jgi:CubicO group peptidase (beta-lactamase class C family)